VRKLTKSPIAWGFIATIAYFLGLAAFLILFGKFPLKLLDLNEAGDFFAGAFAPLAFVWLVVAVFLQKQELGAQREQLSQQMEELKLSRAELKLNREELQLNRELLQEQSEELRKQSEDISSQRIALDENTNIRRFETECESFIRKLILELRKFRWSEPGINGISAYNYYTDPVPKMLAADQFAEAAKEIQIPLDRIIQSSKFTFISTGNLSKLQSFLASLVRKIEANDNISRSFEAYELNKLLEMVTKVHEKSVLKVLE